MPSPIAHTAAGYAIYYLSRSRAPQTRLTGMGQFPTLLIVTTGFSLLPDVDSVLGFLTGNFGRFHNNATHSLIVGLGMALAFGFLMRWKERSGFGFWFIIALLGYELHVLMDSATIGRGVMPLWPFTTERYRFPIIVFYGLHWSQGWFSLRHLWTAATESAFAALVGFIRHGLVGKIMTARSLSYADRDDAAHAG
jgi:membrane-bound metal-dependent hydrolase YbcI (DUF457 family)